MESKKLVSIFSDDEDGICYVVENQFWSKKAIKELWDDHKVIFDSNGVVGVKVKGNLIQLGIEDDGALFFEKNGGICIHFAWIDSLIKVLKLAKELIVKGE